MANQGHNESVPMKPSTAVDNDGNAHGSSDTDEEKKDRSDGDYAASEGGEDYAASEGTEEEEREMQEYRRILEESDGFDIGKAPTKNYIGGRAELVVKDLEDARTTDCIEAVNVAIELENEVEGANLEFVEVIKANWTGFTYYWVTFLARNKTTGEVNTYQSKIYNNLADGEIEIDLFRLKPSGDSTAIQA
ncbi:uncharacterized protein LOC126660127 [Mercurialis annua]|uniref:uncharacterized protein LOC126660127 n=1 Tax=Mercurialis annua TaxID=3986 RepID=UPI002160AE45|nr:uncharacterized protein LOC126660127 [Mercurialis annua]